MATNSSNPSSAAANSPSGGAQSSTTGGLNTALAATQKAFKSTADIVQSSQSAIRQAIQSAMAAAGTAIRSAASDVGEHRFEAQHGDIGHTHFGFAHGKRLERRARAEQGEHRERRPESRQPFRELHADAAQRKCQRGAGGKQEGPQGSDLFLASLFAAEAEDQLHDALLDIAANFAVNLGGIQVRILHLPLQ